MPDILITEFMDEAAVATLAAEFDVDYAPTLADAQDDIPGRLGGARALIVRNRTRVTADLLAAAPALACVGRLGVGLDNIALDACEARGVAVYPATGEQHQCRRVCAYFGYGFAAWRLSLEARDARRALAAAGTHRARDIGDNAWAGRVWRDRAGHRVAGAGTGLPGGRS
jgi:hypothetical protein